MASLDTWPERRRGVRWSVSVAASAVACLVTLLVFWDSDALQGEYVYDDAGSVERNPAVIIGGRRRNYNMDLAERQARGENISGASDAHLEWRGWQNYAEHDLVPDLELIWLVDYWGTELRTPQSHKSFRPVTSASFRLNYIAHGHDKFGFHAVNIALHLMVTALSCFVGDFVLGQDGLGALVAGLLFGLHPVHTEAVSNITSRGEILMALFYLLGLLTFMSGLERRRGALQTVLGTVRVCVAPVACMVLAMLSKEQGITLGVSCAVYDFSRVGAPLALALADLWRSVAPRSAVQVGDDDGPERSKQGAERDAEEEDHDSAERKARAQDVRWFVARAATLAAATVATGLWRLSLNGEGRPNIVPEQNPAAFAEDAFTRIFSVAYVHYSYLESVLLPVWLCCDWSGPGIPLIESLADARVLQVLALWAAVLGALGFSLGNFGGDARALSFPRRAVLNSVLGCAIVPFLLSSNLFVKVGAMKAERVLYLPSLGVCLLAGLAVWAAAQRLGRSNGGRLPLRLQLPLLAVLALLAAKTEQRAHAWSHSLVLWEAAHETNFGSPHARYNLALELTKAKRFNESVALLDMNLEGKPWDYATRYVRAINLRQMGRCDVAFKDAEDALAMLDEKRKNVAADDVRTDLAHDEGLMLTVKSYCASNVADMGRFAQKALEVSPHNSQALGRANELMQLVARQQQMLQEGQQQGDDGGHKVKFM